MNRRPFFWFSLIVIGAVVVGVAILSILSRRQPGLGLVNGRLTQCPNTSNCVCSQSGDRRHSIEPIAFEGSAGKAIERLDAIVRAMPGAEIKTRREDYLHAEVTSKWFRFVDDVEFHVDSAAGLIHFRSASRVGRSDFGVNRRRMEEIRQSFLGAS